MYKTFFEDNTEFIGGNPENSLWNKMPDKPIKKIEYSLLNHTAIFENYESYNHLAEKVEFILTNKKCRITKVLLMAKKNDIVYIFIFDLFLKKVYQDSYTFGKEYCGKSTTGWKKGLENLSTHYCLI